MLMVRIQSMRHKPERRRSSGDSQFKNTNKKKLGYN